MEPMRLQPNGHDLKRESLEAENNEEVLLCRICGDKASGLHYGVYACEGCKGFFRRSINQKIQYRPCLRNHQCTITRVNRNRCQKCRLKKCVAVGMNRDAVRFGRVPKIEKLRMRKQVESANGWKRLQSIQDAMNEEESLSQTVVVAHYMTCELTRGRLHDLLTRSYQQNSVVQSTVACPLNPDPPACAKFDRSSEKVTAQAQRVVEFAKRLPGFIHLCDEDQRTLLKSGSFEVLLIRMADLFSACPQSRRALVFTTGHLYFHDTVRLAAGNTTAGNGGFLLDSMFDFAERFNALRLTDEEKALFSAVIFFSAGGVVPPGNAHHSETMHCLKETFSDLDSADDALHFDRPGLRYPAHVQMIQDKLLEALNTCTEARNSDLLHELIAMIADLRTLNTIHTEKLFGLEKESHIDASANNNGIKAEIIDKPRDSEEFVAPPPNPHEMLPNGNSMWTTTTITDQRQSRISPPSVCSTPSRFLNTNTSGGSPSDGNDGEPPKLVISSDSPDTTSSSSKSVPTRFENMFDPKRGVPQVVCQTPMGTFHRNNSPMNFAHLLEERRTANVLPSSSVGMKLIPTDSALVSESKPSSVTTEATKDSSCTNPKKFWKKRAIEQFEADIVKEEELAIANQAKLNTQLLIAKQNVLSSNLNRCPVQIQPAAMPLPTASLDELLRAPRAFPIQSPHLILPQVRKIPLTQLSPIAEQLLRQLESMPGARSHMLPEQYLTMLADIQNSIASGRAPPLHNLLTPSGSVPPSWPAPMN